MSTYELDDDLVRIMVNNGDLFPPGLQPLLRTMAAQIPRPVPTKLGAVVRCDVQLTAEETTLFVRWSAVADHPFPWIQAGTNYRRMPLDYNQETKSNYQIGRITEVLFEGVDL